MKAPRRIIFNTSFDNNNTYMHWYGVLAVDYRSGNFYFFIIREFNNKFIPGWRIIKLKIYLDSLPFVFTYLKIPFDDKLKA